MAASQWPRATLPIDTEAMDIDPIDSVEEAQKSSPGQRRAARLNALVAITVALLLATFMGICKVKDDNIVQAIQQAQADKPDHWPSIRPATSATT
jgi:hypothetical protein